MSHDVSKGLDACTMQLPKITESIDTKMNNVLILGEVINSTTARISSIYHLLLRRFLNSSLAVQGNFIIAHKEKMSI